MHPDSPFKSKILGDLSTWLWKRYSITQSQKDFEETVTYGEQALGSSVPGSRQFDDLHNLMATIQLHMIRQKPDIQEIDKDIGDFQTDAAAMLENKHPLASRFLDRACLLHATRYTVSNSIKDLEKAIEHGYKRSRCLSLQKALRLSMNI